MEEIVSRQTGDSEPSTDYALLRPPIEMSTSGAVQVFRCLQNGTGEVSDLLLHECDLIYECKVCRSMFRGLPNFISHKRVYCTKYYQDRMVNFVQGTDENETVVVTPESPEQTMVRQAHKSQKEQNDTEANKSVLNQMLDGSFEGSSATYQFYTKAAEQDARKKEDRKTTMITLNAIQGNENAMYQTVKEKKPGEALPTPRPDVHKPVKSTSSTSESTQNRSEVESIKPGVVVKRRSSALLEALCKNTGIVKPPIQEDEDSNASATPSHHATSVVDTQPAKQEQVVQVYTSSRGRQHHKTKWGNNPVPIAVKLAQRKDCNSKTLTCLKCNTQYSSRKTLHFHMVSIHSEKRRFYPCIYCGTTFVQMWGVVRHVIRTHKKSRFEVDKLRDALRKKSFTKKVTASDTSLKLRDISPIKESRKVVSAASDSTKMKKEKDASPRKTGSPPSSSGSKASRSPKVLPASEDKTTIQFTKNFTLHKCTLCGKAFAKRDLLNKHLLSCNKADQKVDDEASSSVSTVSSRPRRVIRAKRPLYESEEETGSEISKVTPGKRAKVETSEANKKSDKQNKKPKTLVKEKQQVEELKKNPPQFPKKGQAYIDWNKVDKLIDKEQLQCKKCKAQYSSLYNVRRHVCQHMDWNRYKCKLCKFSAFHPCECRRHLSRVHPVAFKRTSDYHKLITDLHLSKQQSSKKATIKTKKNQIVLKSKPEKTSTKKVVRKESSPEKKKSQGTENPYARALKKITRTKTRSPENINKLTTLCTRSGHYPKSNKEVIGSSKTYETLRGRLSASSIVSPSSVTMVTGGNKRQSLRGQSPSLSSSTSSVKPSPPSRGRSPRKAENSTPSVSPKRSESPIISRVRANNSTSRTNSRSPARESSGSPALSQRLIKSESKSSPITSPSKSSAGKPNETSSPQGSPAKMGSKQDSLNSSPQNRSNSSKSGDSPLLSQSKMMNSRTDIANSPRASQSKAAGNPQASDDKNQDVQTENSVTKM